MKTKVILGTVKMIGRRAYPVDHEVGAARVWPKTDVQALLKRLGKRHLTGRVSVLPNAEDPFGMIGVDLKTGDVLRLEVSCPVIA